MMSIQFSSYRIVSDDYNFASRAKNAAAFKSLEGAMGQLAQPMNEGLQKDLKIEVSFRPIEGFTFAENLDKPHLGNRIYAQAKFRRKPDPINPERGNCPTYYVGIAQNVPYTLRQLAGLTLMGLGRPLALMAELPQLFALAVKAPFSRPEKLNAFITRFVAEVGKKVDELQANNELQDVVKR